MTVPVESYNGSCNYLEGRKAIGKATFERTKSDSVNVTYTVTGALPAGNSYLYLLADHFTGSPFGCIEPGYGGKIKIDASGHGSKTFEITDLAGYTDFWVYASSDNPLQYDRSAIAHV